MTTQAKLTDTQTAILKAAAGRPDGNIEPLPTTLRGGARTKVIEGLLARGLIVDVDGNHLLTDAGYTAIGKRRPVPKGIQKMDAHNDVAKRDAPDVFRVGRPITKQNLYKTLRNPIYLGVIRHKGKNHPGQHEAIIDQALWDRVQAILAEDAHARMGATRTCGKTDALLRGLLYGANGEKYHITFSTKPSGKKYRYYIPKADRCYGRGTSATGMIPADQIEEVVVNLVISALQVPEAVQGIWNQVERLYPEIAEPTVVLAMRRLGEVWKQLFPEEQVRLVNLLIERVQLLSDGIDIVWREVGWKELAGELTQDSIGGELLEAEVVA